MSPAPAGRPPLRVCVIDDDPDAAELLTLLLQGEGFDAVVLEPGPAVAEHLAGAPADVLITDLLMPGIDGATLAAQARRACPSLQVWLATGMEAARVPVPPDGRPFEQVFLKPLEPDDIVAALRALQARAH